MTKRTELPIIVVMGATGTGKSKLSIELAQKFNGEIINADSLQVYKGLDIVTNKVTREELDMVPHHLIDFLDPLTPMTVVDYRNRALEVIDRLFDQNKIPVIVGGTQYYIESLLYDVLIDADKVKKEDFLFNQDKKQQINISQTESDVNHENIFSNPILMSSFREVSSPHLHAILTVLDAESASVLHPNEKRKIIRALQVMQRNNGKTYSSLLQEQQSKSGGSSLGGPLRFAKTIIFWTHTQEDLLNKRLDDRVDDMLSNGLIQELQDFYEKYADARIERGFKPDYSEGIFQAIGFKDFHNYLILEERKRTKRLLEDCLYDMKVQTRKYAKKQMKVIRNRMIEATDRQVPPIFLLDSSKPEEWNEVVRDKAFQILHSFMTQQSFPIDLQPLNNLPQTHKNIDRKTIKRCDICDKVLQGDQQWAAHVSSKGHKALSKMKTKELHNDSSSVSKELYSKNVAINSLES